MTRRNAILMVVDRLGAGFLGPYGNTWLETPAWNRLASESLLWEYTVNALPTLAGTYEALATGRHPLAPELPAAAASRLWQSLQQSGIHTALITDEPRLAQVASMKAIAERIEQTGEDPTAASLELEQTGLCQSFVTLLDWLARPQEPFCLLFHARGMGAAWDAPQEYRERFADEEDPPVPAFVEPPRRSLGQDVDPDEIWGIVQAYAGQIVLLDLCLEMLLDWLHAHALRDNTLLIVTSPRGYPLGEHGHIGERGDELYEEVLHVPMLIRRPDQQFAMQRCQTLAQPADLFTTLAEWFQLPLATGPTGMSLLAPVAPDAKEHRDCVVSVLNQARSIRTPAWFLRKSDEQNPQLYAKPDDRWEVNEVAHRGGEITEELLGRLVEYERLAHEDRLAEFAPLAPHLVSRFD